MYNSRARKRGCGGEDVQFESEFELKINDKKYKINLEESKQDTSTFDKETRVAYVQRILQRQTVAPASD